MNKTMKKNLGITALAILGLIWAINVSHRGNAEPPKRFLIGDSIVGLAPYPLPRLGMAGAPVESIADFLDKVPDIDQYEHFIICAGTVNFSAGEPSKSITAKIEVHLVKPLRALNPSAEITVIPSELVHKIAEKHSSDGWHLDADGYEILSYHYPILR